MTKHKWRIVAVASLILLAFAIERLRENPPLLYYMQLTTPHQLPTRLVRPAFRLVANRELPEKTDGLVAVFVGGRDPGIFVRFETDSDGVAYILESFGGPDVKSEILDAERLASRRESGWQVFPGLARLEAKLGVCLFDANSIESGRLLQEGGDPRGQPGYTVFIDAQGIGVYMRVWCL